MKRRILLVALLLAARPGSVAFADDLIVMAPGGLRGPFEQLAPDFERATGNKITLQFLSGGTVKESVTRGATFDVVVMQPPYDAALKSGNVVASSATQLASVAVGGAVKAGAARPKASKRRRSSWFLGGIFLAGSIMQVLESP